MMRENLHNREAEKSARERKTHISLGERERPIFIFMYVYIYMIHIPTHTNTHTHTHTERESERERERERDFFRNRKRNSICLVATFTTFFLCFLVTKEWTDAPRSTELKHVICTKVNFWEQWYKADLVRNRSSLPLGN